MVYSLLLTLYSLLWEAAAGVEAGLEVYGEGEIAVGLEVPAGAVEVGCVGVGEGEAFPAKAGGLPADTVGVEG